MITKLSLIIVVVSCASAVYFDCGRTGQTCMNGASCNRETGNCTCVGNFEGYNCALETASRVSTGCTNDCQNGATCTTSGCYCPEEFYGPKCENRRAETTCTGNSLNIVIVPFGNFNGLVYVKGNMSTPECQFTMSEVNGMKMYSANLTFSSNCSIKATAPTADQQKYETDVIIQNSPVFETSYDITVDASCTQGTTGQAAVGGGVGAVAVDDAANKTEDATSTVYEPVSLELLQEDDSPIPKKLFLGTPLKLVFKLSDTQKFKKIRLSSCMAVAGGVNATIIENGCPTPTGKAILSKPIMREQTPLPKISVFFNAFRFPSSSTVNFQCAIALCESEEDSKCSEPSCGSRKKRSINEPSDIGGSVIVKKEVTVLDANEQGAIQVEETNTIEDVIEPREEEPQPQANAEECLMSNEILAVVIALVVAVVFLLVSTLCLAAKFIRSSAQGKRIDGPLPMSRPNC